MVSPDTIEREQGSEVANKLAAADALRKVKYRGANTAARGQGVRLRTSSRSRARSASETSSPAPTATGTEECTLGSTSVAQSPPPPTHGVPSGCAPSRMVKYALGTKFPDLTAWRSLSHSIDHSRSCHIALAESPHDKVPRHAKQKRRITKGPPHPAPVTEYDTPP